MTLLRLIPALLLVLSLGACGEDSPGSASGSGSGSGSGEEFNDADVEFATGMIPHHAQALVMVDMTMGRKLSPDMVELTEQIRAAQAPEIESMAGWLTDWDKPVPETMRDHANAHGGHMEDSDMPGMMTQEELDELETTRGPAFEDMWLEMMIEHHEGAVEMARTEIDDGSFQPAIRLAEDIVEGQTAEIEQMERMLGG